MFTTTSSQVMLAVLLGSCAYAWFKGGSPERVGSLFNAVVSLAVTVFQVATADKFETLPVLVADGVLATGFLLLALRYASLWLAFAMMLQAAAFTMHSAVLMGIMPPNLYYVLAMNLASAFVLVAIIAGTTSAWMRRREARARLS